METVQLQCGQCKKLIGIRVEHMGMQVQCPHCKSVVQTPSPASEAATLPPPSPPPQPPAGIPNMEIQQRESIFGGPEESDSVIDNPLSPKMEVPSPLPPADTTPASIPQAATAPSGEAETDFSQFKRRPTFDKSVIPLLILIFLVPYALLTTSFIAYLLFVQPKPAHPLDYLIDPAAGKDKGGPRSGARYGPKFDTPLAEHQRTTIGKSIKAGDLLLTPTHVMLTPDGDIKLILKARNVSTGTKFEPINGSYLRPKGLIQPYSYLESKSGSLRLNAVDLGYHTDPKAADDARGFALLSAGEEVTIALTSDIGFRKKDIPQIAKAADDSYTWRVQVRRGFVKVDGKDVSATTVIGVDFSRSEIERANKG
ncbi:MAG TPA: hypothetical protein VFE62_20385 [Gemmataceae bacterium]|nr:hypothetical protein [Gemmataceae bacterium]